MIFPSLNHHNGLGTWNMFFPSLVIGYDFPMMERDTQLSDKLVLGLGHWTPTVTDLFWYWILMLLII